MQFRLIGVAYFRLASILWLTLLFGALPLWGGCAKSTNPDPTDRDTGPGPLMDGGLVDATADSSSPPTDAGTDTAIVGPTCGLLTCEVFERCVDDACAPYPACVADSECAVTDICRNRFCLPRSADIDGDGVSAETDCDEANPTRYPGATEACDGADQDCDELIDEDVTRGCATACGMGTERCEGGVFGGCDAPPVGTETCDGTDEDCDGSIDEGLSRACSTACGSGDETCRAGSWVMCDAPPVPAESCNLLDDDCDGSCDERASCRTGVHRSYDSSTGEHFYSSSAPEAACCGYTVEHYNFYYLYSAGAPGLVPFYRCLLANGFHFYTQSATCEGSAGAVREGTVGYIARSSGVCGSVPLYRLVKGADHFFTPHASERNNAIITFGYGDEGVAGYVWLAP